MNEELQEREIQNQMKTNDVPLAKLSKIIKYGKNVGKTDEKSFSIFVQSISGIDFGYPKIRFLGTIPITNGQQCSHLLHTKFAFWTQCNPHIFRNAKIKAKSLYRKIVSLASLDSVQSFYINLVQDHFESRVIALLETQN